MACEILSGCSDKLEYKIINTSLSIGVFVKSLKIILAKPLIKNTI